MLAVLAVLGTSAYAGLVAYAILQKYTLDILYTYHPLAACAFFLFAILGISTAQRARKQPGSHKALINQHGLWQLAATLCAISTAVIIWVNKERKGSQHLKSWHGKMGAATTCLWLVTHAFGVVSWYAPQLLTGGKQGSSKAAALARSYIMHGLSGVAALGLLLATHGLALAGSYQGYRKGSQGWMVLAGLLALVGLTMFSSAVPLTRRAARLAFGRSARKTA